jgi:hypothetical protein
MSHLLRHYDRIMSSAIVEQGSRLSLKIVSPAERATEDCAARRKDEHGVTTPP